MNRFLKYLDRQAQVDFIGCDILADGRQIGRLYAVQKDEEGQYFVVGPPLPHSQQRIILYIRSKVSPSGLNNNLRFSSSNLNLPLSYYCVLFRCLYFPLPLLPVRNVLAGTDFTLFNLQAF